MTENCASFAFPLYRDGKIARVLLSRYIGTGKLRESCFPAISGRENCASFGVPIYRIDKTAFVVPSRNIRAPKLAHPILNRLLLAHFVDPVPIQFWPATEKFAIFIPALIEEAEGRNRHTSIVAVKVVVAHYWLSPQGSFVRLRRMRRTERRSTRSICPGRSRCQTDGCLEGWAESAWIARTTYSSSIGKMSWTST